MVENLKETCEYIAINTEGLLSLNFDYFDKTILDIGYVYSHHLFVSLQ